MRLRRELKYRVYLRKEIFCLLQVRARVLACRAYIFVFCTLWHALALRRVTGSETGRNATVRNFSASRTRRRAIDRSLSISRSFRDSLPGARHGCRELRFFFTLSFFCNRDMSFSPSKWEPSPKFCRFIAIAQNTHTQNAFTLYAREPHSKHIKFY